MRDRVYAAVITTVLCAILMCGCTVRDDEFSAFREMPRYGWVYSEPAVLVPEHADSIATGPLLLVLRNDDTYPYANIWVEVSGKDIRDTLNLRLADVYGNWLGKGLGSTREVTATVRDRYTHRSGDTIRVRHILRTDTLPGITLVGLELNFQP